MKYKLEIQKKKYLYNIHNETVEKKTKEKHSYITMKRR